MRETASLSGVILKLSTTVRMIWGKGMMVRLGSGGMDGFEIYPSDLIVENHFVWMDVWSVLLIRREVWGKVIVLDAWVVTDLVFGGGDVIHL